jgi:hypothetical protein
VAGIGVDFGLARGQAWLGQLAGALRWEKGTGFFYAESALRFVQELHWAFATVLYLGAFLAFGAMFLGPVWQRRRLRRSSRGKLAEAARAHPVIAERVLPWGAGFAWLGLSATLPMFAQFLVRFGWNMQLETNAHYLYQDAAYALSQANNLGFVLGSVVAITGVAAAARFGIRKLASDEEQPAARPELVEKKGSFSAVAVTASTRGAVAGLAAASIAMAWFAATATSNARLAPAVFAYVLIAVGTATAFRRMSRIVVGIDGILVLGADKARFFGFAGLGGVKPSGSDILLQRNGKTALRLQLHDDDVARAPALAARIQVAMDHAAQMRSEGADRLMQTTHGTAAASQRLASSSRGGLDYRQPAIAREQLWQLVEGPVSDAEGRRVAAEALAQDMSSAERERLRVAVEKCAEPRARVALKRLLDEDDDDQPELNELEPAIVPRRRFS